MLANPAWQHKRWLQPRHVVAVSSFASEGLKTFADVILPLAPMAESEGLFYTLDGQSFEMPSRLVKLPDRPNRVGKFYVNLGAELELDGFTQVRYGRLCVRRCWLK